VAAGIASVERDLAGYRVRTGVTHAVVSSVADGVCVDSHRCGDRYEALMAPCRSAALIRRSLEQGGLGAVRLVAAPAHCQKDGECDGDNAHD
jgi:hypothetical protein